MAHEATSWVVGKAVDSLLDVAKTQIGYIWNSNENVEKLKNEAENLKLMRGKVRQQINIAKRKGDDLVQGVQEWVDKSDLEISKSQEFLVQETNAKKAKLGFLFGKWSTRYQYGKQATTMAPFLLEHQERGKDFVTCVSVETPAPTQLDVYENKNLEDLVTHNEALDDIFAALKDESIQIIGIYGLGGVGKTTLAKEVVARVKNNLLFAHVAFTTVSQTVNANKIQTDIGNATRRIMKGDKILIILDDVWETLDLQELCIPCGINHKNCKILLTSRSQDVCDKMNAQSKICVNSLPTAEAWILFKRVVGKKLETDVDLKPVAMMVAEECGGLPLLIQAVGNALKHKNIHVWNSALSRLKKHTPSEVDPDIQKAFTRLKLSYDYLESEEAKSCFLLCSMFPEDHNIWLEDLVYYAVGLRKFDDVDSMKDAREKVQNAVNILASSGLLLNSKYKYCTRMHDVVRDVALLIASEGENKYLVKAGKDLTEWLPRDRNLKNYKGISLMDNMISKLPDYEVHLSSLDIFLLCGNCDLPMISDEFLGSMTEIKALDISWNNISSLPQSFQLLTKLRMLDLRGNKSLNEISILGELKDLEILNLNRTGITEIPKEIAQLVNLILLEVNDCEDLSRIRQGVISALSRLEELCIEFKLKFKGASDCIVEVVTLSKLTYLNLTVASIDDIPAQGFNSEKLKGFVIQIGECNRDNGPSTFFISRSGRYLVLSIVHLRIPLVKWLQNLIKGSHPVTILKSIENLNNIMPTLYHQGFNKLEHIELWWCDNVSCLVDSTMCDWDQGKTEEKFFVELKELRLYHLYKLEVLWKCQEEYLSLTNLVNFHIDDCEKLVRGFIMSVAQGLVNLKYLTIKYCDVLEEVIWSGGYDESIVFPSLTNISFKYLYKLKSFN